MFRPLRRYADFRGRSGRREFWCYSLFLMLGYLSMGAVALILAMTNVPGEAIGVTLGIGWALFFIANFVPGLALTTRRLHDLGLSGVLLVVAFLALMFANILGWLGYLIVMSLPGQAKTNRWGPPLGAADVGEVFG